MNECPDIYMCLLRIVCKLGGAGRYNTDEGCGYRYDVHSVLYANHGCHYRVLVWISMTPLNSSGKTRVIPSTNGLPPQPVS